MTGPSATGSEKGMPSSSVSTPASAKAKAASTVKSKEGNPVVIYATNFFKIYSLYVNMTIICDIIHFFDKMSKIIDWIVIR